MKERKSKAIQIRVTPSQYQALERAAKKDRRRVADWVRVAALERAEEEGKTQ